MDGHGSNLDRRRFLGVLGGLGLAGTALPAQLWAEVQGDSPISRETIAAAEVLAGLELDDAGAVLVAKLSLGALAWGDVWFGGTTKNPWNPEEGSSGSSAGPAAATAAGLVGFSIGSETWGSMSRTASPRTAPRRPSPSSAACGARPRRWRWRGRSRRRRGITGAGHG